MAHSSRRRDPDLAPRAGGRVRGAWRALDRDQRLVCLAALGLFASMLLPWYEKSFAVRTRFVKDDLSAFGAFSFVEAAVLLVAAAVLYLLLARAERRAFHLPGGDGTVIMAAGTWAALLLVWRLFDKPAVTGANQAAATVGLQWGIFVALGAAGALAYAGARVRAAHRPEPPLPLAQDPVGPRTGEPATDIRLPDERPHLDETEVIGGLPPPSS